ncbi:hypothetical protein OAV41_01760 [Planctomycetota bacterium]|nr:hypothetical protein [Planctomycetota bacterium]
MSGGGGGGSTTTQSSGIDPEFKPYLKRVLADVTNRYESEVAGGPDSMLAKLDPRQIAALDAQTQLGQQAISGRGIYDTSGEVERMLRNVEGKAMQQQSKGGALSSARAQKARQAVMADMGYDFAKQRQADALLGMQQLGEAGSALQEYEQARLDAPHTSASRYFGYLGNAPQQQTQTTKGGGK